MNRVLLLAAVDAAVLEKLVAASVKDMKSTMAGSDADTSRTRGRRTTKRGRGAPR